MAGSDWVKASWELEPLQVGARSPVIPPATEFVTSETEYPASDLGHGRKEFSTAGDNCRQAHLRLNCRTGRALT